MSGGDNTNKVVFLQFKTPEVEGDMMAFICCKHCRNKTFTLIEDRVGSFPLMRCAACSKHIGRIGWADEDEET